MDKPALFLDFDNTVTRGDVLDAVIERFSPNDRWREWEQAWQEGRISTRECLLRQMANLRVTATELLDFVSVTEIDPHFAQIVEWSAREQIGLTIVSDNFSVLVRTILHNNGIRGIPVFANELAFSGNRAEASFPYRDPFCPRCAHCKAQHLSHCAARPRIFVGDGLSDICPAECADVVFAKGSLLRHFREKKRLCVAFNNLDDIYNYFKGLEK